MVGKRLLIRVMYSRKGDTNWNWKVVGLQYYHIAKIILAISTPRATALGYERLREGRKLEVTCPKPLYLLSSYLTYLGIVGNCPQAPSCHPGTSCFEQEGREHVFYRTPCVVRL